MKKAFVVPYVVHVDCPYCHDGITNTDNGSYMWNLSMVCAGQVITCDECGKESQLPMWTQKVKVWKS